ncbi:hypothetical protein ACNKHS_12470 [Shigella flexneri]
MAWRIGRAYGECLKPQTIVLGGDVRLTSESLNWRWRRLQGRGRRRAGYRPFRTEEMYFATLSTWAWQADIEVTAGHGDPMDYNGMKLVRKGGTSDQRRHRPA